jgi:hypothetical protein
LDELVGLINCILTVNRTAKSLKTLRDQATKSDPNLEMEKGLLLYQEQLIVPDVNNLQTELIREAHC